jgi:hypothetical protein
LAIESSNGLEPMKKRHDQASAIQLKAAEYYVSNRDDCKKNTILYKSDSWVNRSQ